MFEINSFKNPLNKYALLQIAHDFQFVALNLKDEYKWPADCDEEYRISHIGKRLKRLKELGYAGVVISVAFEKYMEDEQAWSRLCKTVEMAKEKDFRVWMYDEQYYPSGFAGGLTLRDRPELEAQGLVCVMRDIDSPDAPTRIASPLGHSSLKYAYAVPLADNRPDYSGQIDISHLVDAGGGLSWYCAGGTWRVYTFFTRTLYEGTYLPYSLRAPQRNINVCDDRAVKHFLDVTFDRYAKYLGNKLGRDIETVFTDEPSLFTHRDYPAGYNPDERYHKKYPSFSVYERPNVDIPLYPFIHWTYNMSQKFEELCGYSLTDNLPRLFDGGNGCEKLRLDYFETVSSLFDNAWNRQYRKLLHQLHMNYSGHMFGEESIFSHPVLFGDIIRNLGAMDIPGCDLLSSDPDVIRHAVACKAASSAAHLYGRKHVMIEASNMFDKDQTLTLDGVCLAMAIEFALGVDTITSYYGENIFSDEEYKLFNAYVARLGQLFDGGVHQTQALIYYPFKQIAAVSAVQKPTAAGERAKRISQSFTALSSRLLEKQIDFDYINDECFLKGSSENGAFLPGNGEKPRIIFLPEIDFVPEDTARKLHDAVNAGVKVIVYGVKRPISGLENCDGLCFMEEDGLPETEDFITGISCPWLLCMHKRFDGQDLYLLVNTGKSEIETLASIPRSYGSMKQLCIKTGSVKELTAKHAGNRLHFMLSLKPGCAVVLANQRA